MGSISETVKYDVILIGAGFGGLTMLPRLRDLGLSVKIFERGTASGGVWHSNRYPGARVDTDLPVYQFFDKEIWEDFTFSERFPGSRELQKYFAYVVDKLNLRKDIMYEKDVKSASWLEESHSWEVTCSDGTVSRCKWLFANVGFAAKSYIPDLPGLSSFRGEIYHTAQWPEHEVELKNKKIAVIGTGASGIQVIQESGPVCKHLTVFQRTPNLCLPMHQRKMDLDEERRKKQDGRYDEAFEACRKTRGGVPYEPVNRRTFDDTPEEREALWNSLMIQGGFRFWVANYNDLSTDQRANDAAYAHWRGTVLKRVRDPQKAALVAPEKPPHPYGAKRPSLEQNYYEVLSQDNVDIVDLNQSPIQELTATGINTAAGHVDVDLIVLATGFDGLTGGFLDIDLQGKDGRTLKEYWKEGARTSTGVSIPGFPNLFFIFGPQAPSTFSNGPTCIQMQGDWFKDLLERLESERVMSFEAREEAAEHWQEQVREAWEATLLAKTKISSKGLTLQLLTDLWHSWWNGGNIPGKKVQPLAYAGGLPDYMKTLNRTLEHSYQGWIVS